MNDREIDELSCTLLHVGYRDFRNLNLNSDEVLGTTTTTTMLQSVTQTV